MTSQLFPAGLFAIYQLGMLLGHGLVAMAIACKAMAGAYVTHLAASSFSVGIHLADLLSALVAVLPPAVSALAHLCLISALLAPVSLGVWYVLYA
jgi:hypothetical protein